MNQQNKPNWLLIAVLAVGIFLALKYFNNSPSPNPTPSDLIVVEEDVEGYIHNYALLLSDDFSEASELVKSGKIKTAKQYSDYIQKETEKSRIKAFTPLGNYENKFIKETIEDKDTTSMFLNAVSNGFNKAGK